MHVGGVVPEEETEREPRNPSASFVFKDVACVVVGEVAGDKAHLFAARQGFQIDGC